MKKEPAIIDGKNLSSDFVYEMFDGCGEFIDKINISTFHIVGYFNNRLIEVKWLKKSSRICFAFVDLMENHHTEDDEKKLIDYIKRVDADNIEVDVWKSCGWIITDWYIKI